jgi:flagellar basal-body rod protein FlgC
VRLFDGFAISGSGMTAQRLRLDLIAGNLANVHSTQTPEGGPYRRRFPIFAQHLAVARGFSGAGVVVQSILQDQSPPQKVLEPGHPDADAEGYVGYPNINVADEMVDLVLANRAYQANATVFETSKDLAEKALELGRG